jgi:hypothetical protein
MFLLSLGLFLAASSVHASDCLSELWAKDAAISIIGAFNMRYTDEHAYGYEVQLRSKYRGPKW